MWKYRYVQIWHFIVEIMGHSLQRSEFFRWIEQKFYKSTVLGNLLTYITLPIRFRDIITKLQMIFCMSINLCIITKCLSADNTDYGTFVLYVLTNMILEVCNSLNLCLTICTTIRSRYLGKFFLFLENG